MTLPELREKLVPRTEKGPTDGLTTRVVVARQLQRKDTEKEHEEPPLIDLDICHVCEGADQTDDNKLLHCDSCLQFVHQRCEVADVSDLQSLGEEWQCSWCTCEQEVSLHAPVHKHRAWMLKHQTGKCFLCNQRVAGTMDEDDDCLPDDQPFHPPEPELSADRKRRRDEMSGVEQERRSKEADTLVQRHRAARRANGGRLGGGFF